LEVENPLSSYRPFWIIPCGFKPTAAENF